MKNFDVRPELLAHPNIPPPLQGLNPRSILGNAWWDRVRQIAYKHHDFHCWACGIHKYAAHYHKHLEAHEAYTINYQTGVANLDEVVALCHCCHNFIHSGRMEMMVERGEMSRFKQSMILAHGAGILKRAGLVPWWGTLMYILMSDGMPRDKAIVQAQETGKVYFRGSMAPWKQWRLLIDGDEYFTPYENEADHNRQMREKYG